MLNNTQHWDACECGATSNYGDHVQVSGNDYCSVCDKPFYPTEGVVYGIAENGTYAEVTGYTGTASKVKIADTYQDLPVKSIGYRAFGDKSITYIEVPDSVTSIGWGAFEYCDSLTIYCEAESKPSGWYSGWNSVSPVYWYSENQPTTSGNYWHYVNGVVTKW